MGTRKLKIWIFFLLAIVVVGFMLFQQSQNNKVQLDNQAIRNLEMVKSKFFSFYNTFLAEQEDKFIRYLITENVLDQTPLSNRGDWGEFAKSLKTITGEQYEDFKLWQLNDNIQPSLQIIFSKGQYAIKKEGHPVSLNFFQNSQSKTKGEQRIEPKIALQIQLENALSLSAQHDFFEKILLADEDGEILYPATETGKKLSNLTEKEGLGLAINKSEILHQDRSYLLYSTPFLVEGKKLILAGLISKTHFESLGLRVDFTYLALLLFLLALMIFSLPVISLFGFRQGDVLTRFKVFSVGFSVLGFMLLIGFGFAFLRDHHPLSSDQHHAYQRQISDAIKTQIDLNSRLLDNPHCCEGLLEYLTIDSFGRMKNLTLEDRELPGKGSFINLANREYFYYFWDNGSLRHPEGESFEYKGFIGSHYSRINGKLETVLSKVDSQKEEVRAVTFVWEVLKPLSKKHRFVLLKDNGDVIFKSDLIKAPFDNLSQLLSNEKWLLLKRIMQSNSNESANGLWDLSLYVDGYSYKLNLRKPDIKNFDKSIWLIYLQDEHLEHSFSMLVVMEFLVLLAGYFFVLTILSFARWSIKPKSPYGLWEDFTCKYLFPTRQNRPSYLILILLFLLQMLIMLGLYHNPLVSVFTLYFSALCFLILSTQLNFIFLEMKWDIKADKIDTEERNNRFYALKFLGITSLVMIILAIILNGAMRNPFSAYLIVILLILFCFISFLIKIRFEKYFAKFENNEGVSWLKRQIPWLQTNHLYAWFFVVWITLIGFFPGFMLFSKTFFHEKELWQNKSESVETSIAEFSNWTSEYGKWRRNLFSTIPVREEGELLEFISPPTAHVEQVILTKMDRNPDFLTFAKNGYRIFKEANILIVVSIVFLILLIWLIYWLNKTIARKMFFVGGINPKLRETIAEVQGRLLGGVEGVQTEAKDMCKFIFLHRLISDQNKALVADLLRVDRDKIRSYDGKISGVLDHFEPSRSAELKEELVSKNIILIENLHCIADSSKLLERLSCLMKFCQDNQVTLVLITGVSWKHLLSKLIDENDKLYYSEIFSSFVFAYIPIKSRDFKGDFDRVSQIIDENEVIKNDLETKLLLRKRFFKADYTNIWAELSTEEKKVTYEFAVHEFLNYAAAPIIIELIQKGVIVYESGKDRFTLFSDTFRYFILLHISREEKNDFKNLEFKMGNADSIQIAVFSFVLISVALISYFDKSFLDQATTYVTGIIGTIGGLYSVFRSKFWKKSEVTA